jgi:phenylalanyl-tRNA synthetase beta chain
VHPLTLKAFDVKNDVWAFEFNLKNLEKHFDAQTFKKAKDVSNLPTSERDLSFIIDKTIPYAKVQQVLSSIEAKYHLIDLYQGENLAQGKKSMTLHFEFAAKEKTLTDKEVNTAIENILNILKEQLGAELR